MVPARSAGFRCTPPGAERLSRAGLLAPGSLPPPRLPGLVQWRIGARLPGHSCGGSAGFEPASLGALASAGPASRAIRDVMREINVPRLAVQLWHVASGADAVQGDPR